MGGLGIGDLPNSHGILKLFRRVKRSSIVVPVYSLPQIAACLQKNQHEIRVYTGDKLPKDDIPDAFVIPSSMVSSDQECKLGTRLKLAFPKSKIIYIGPFAGHYPEKYLMHGDLVVQGEPERFFLSLSNKCDIPTGIHVSAPIQDLDLLPFPAWQLFDVRKYRYLPALTKSPIVTMLSSRSCVYSCKYCPYPIIYGAYRQRSIASLINEFSYLVNDLGVKSIVFRDPLFLTNSSRLEELVFAIKESKLKFEWTCETRIEYFHKEYLEDLYAVGLRGINCGIESLDTDILKTQDRRDVPIERYKELVSICRDIGIWVTGFFVIGFMSETPASLIDTLEKAKEINFPIVQFTVNTPIPMSPDFLDFEPNLTESDYSKFTFYNLTYEHPNFSYEQIQYFQSKALLEYYFRLSYWMKNFRYFSSKVI